MTDPELIAVLRDMLAAGYELPLGTLKGSVLDKDRGRVEAIMGDLAAAGEVVEIKKHRYAKKEQ